MESLRRLPSPAGEDVRIELVASEAWRALGDFKQSAAFAGQAAQEARTQNAKSLLARALYQKAFALENLGDATGAMNVVGECFFDRIESLPRGESAPPITVDAGDTALRAS